MSADSTVPGKIGKYVVTGVLGGGSMGVVYVGRDPTINRLVALKTIYVPKGLDGDKVVEFQERFLREAQAAGQLSSPAVVTIYEADDGTWGGPPFIAMEYIEGVTWKEMIKRGERMAPDRLVPQVRELAAALSQAHRAGIVHRDIKPANIITTARGGVKLMDFGVARVPTSDLTQEGQFIGTPAYMAPEQIEGKPVDGRADIFSLGCVLYEMLSGAKPFPGDEVTVVTHRILNEEPPLLEKRIQGIPKHLALIVRTMLAKDPRVRYQNADELLSDLYDYEAGRFPSAVKRRMTATPAPAEGAAQVAKRAERRRPSRKDRRRRVWEAAAAATGLIFALLIVTAVVLFFQVRETPPVASPNRPPEVPTRQSLLTRPALRVFKKSPRPVRLGSLPALRKASAGPASKTARRHETSRSGPAKAAPRVRRDSSSSASRTGMAPADQQKSARLSFNFSSHVLKGEFWLKIDGKTVAHKVLDRKFSFHAYDWTGAVSLTPGIHLVRFEMLTKIQDVRSVQDQRVKFSAGQSRHLTVDLNKFTKELEFDWR